MGFEANIEEHEETFYNQFAYLYRKLVELGEKVDVDLRRKFVFGKIRMSEDGGGVKQNLMSSHYVLCGYRF